MYVPYRVAGVWRVCGKDGQIADEVDLSCMPAPCQDAGVYARESDVSRLHALEYVLLSMQGIK